MGKKIMAETVAETIRKITKKHIDNGKGFVIGQCLTAVGWVQNTIPKQTKGIIELPMTDTAGMGTAVGASIVGSRPIIVLRFQSFLWLNSSPLVMHAAKAKEIFGYGAPVFVRAIASEANYGQGPLHGNNYHSPFIHMPGLKVCAPLTPQEYKKIWSKYLKDDSPYLVSEHRNSYKSSREFRNKYNKKAKVTIFAISAARFNALKALEILEKKKIFCNLINIIWLSPFKISKREIEALEQTKRGLVIDSSYTDCGITTTIAYKLMQLTKAKVVALGLENRSSGSSKKTENGTPSAKKIAKTIEKLINS